MGEFTAQDAIRPRWDPALKDVAIRRLLFIAAALVAIAFVGGAFIIFSGLAEGAILWLILVIGPLASAVSAVLLAVVIQMHAIIGEVLAKTAFGVFLGAVIGMVLFAWAVALLFEYTDSVVAAHHAGRSKAAPACACLTTNQILAQLPGGIPQKPRNDPPFWIAVAAYLIWPFQFRIVRDVILALGALGFVALMASFAIWWERKVAGRIQSRLGPMRVGGWHGWAQSIADGLKLIQKEDIVRAGADRVLFKLAPYLVFIPALGAFIALPFAAAWVFRDLDVALIFVLAMLGIDVVGVILGGWASNNKWSMYGAMRVACQMVSYEIPMGMALLVPVMTTGTLRLTEIGELQNGGFATWLAFSNPFALAAAVVYFVASLAACKRAPFDLPEAESELVAGFHTEYSGFRWAVFFFGEYAAMFVVAGLSTILFFGAWHSPLPASWGQALAGDAWTLRAVRGILFSGPLWFVAKLLGFIYVQIWLRWTLPRLRIDQVMYTCVQVLLPMAMVLLLGAGTWEMLVVSGSWPDRIANVLCTLTGATLVVGFVVIAAYGLVNRRQLLGRLVVDHLAGA